MTRTRTKKLIPALLLGLVLAVSALCMALLPSGGTTHVAHASHEHVAAGAMEYNDISHWYACTTEGCDEHVGASEHTYSNWTVIKKATETETGTEAAACICGYTKTRAIPVLAAEPESNGGKIAAIIIFSVLGAAALGGIAWLVVRWVLALKKKKGMALADGERIVGESAVVINPGKARDLRESYKKLPAEQKKYFDELEKLALSVPGARSNPGKNSNVYKIKSKKLLTLSVKRGYVVASFELENEMLKGYRKTSGANVKTKATDIIIIDETDFATAKDVLKVTNEQITREFEYEAEQRRAKRREAYEAKKNAPSDEDKK